MPRERAKTTVETRPASAAQLTKGELEALDRAIAKYRAEAPKIADFSSRPELARQKHEKEVEAQRERIAKQPGRDKEIDRFSAGMEMVMAEFLSSWVRGYVSRSSEYDDYFNGTDMVLELRDANDGILRVAIDVTTSSEQTRGKIADIQRAIEEGRISSLKYFKSQLDASMEEKEVPRVVVGTDNREEVSDLLRLFLRHQEETDPSKRTLMRKAIAGHPLGREIAGEMLIELEWQARSLSRLTQTPDRVARVALLRDTYAELLRLRNKTAAPAPSSSARGRNGVLLNIMALTGARA